MQRQRTVNDHPAQQRQYKVVQQNASIGGGASPALIRNDFMLTGSADLNSACRAPARSSERLLQGCHQRPRDQNSRRYQQTDPDTA